ARAVVGKRVLFLDQQVVVRVGGVVGGAAGVSQHQITIRLGLGQKCEQEYTENQMGAPKVLHWRSPRNDNGVAGPSGIVSAGVPWKRRKFKCNVRDGSGAH